MTTRLVTSSVQCPNVVVWCMPVMICTDWQVNTVQYGRLADAMKGLFNNIPLENHHLRTVSYSWFPWPWVSSGSSQRIFEFLSPTTTTTTTTTTEVQQFTCMCKHAECLWTGTKSVVRQTKRMRRHKYEGDLELVDNIIGWPFFEGLLDRRNDSLGEMLHYNGKKEQVGVFVFHHFPLLFLLFIIIFWDRIFQYTSKLG